MTIPGLEQSEAIALCQDGNENRLLPGERGAGSSRLMKHFWVLQPIPAGPVAGLLSMGSSVWLRRCNKCLSHPESYRTPAIYAEKTAVSSPSKPNSEVI